MKYIRTKDGVYDVLDYLYKNGTACSEILEKQKIAEADTIEELCDCFVYCKNEFYEVYRKLDYYHYDEEYLKNGGTIKGAIWTSKGLIYVAKLNEKGELELI